MISVSNLSVSFGGTYLFEQVSFKCNVGDKVGLVGKNGAGKSTLLKILSKDLLPDDGSLAFEKEIKLGFLRQDIDFDLNKTVLEEVYKAFEDILIIEKSIENINTQLSERTDYESASYFELIEQLSDLTHHFNLLGGYQYQGDTEKILLGLGFKRDDFEKTLQTFSGGWRMRVELAKLLLQKNQVLLLDEPTNHLDIESILWFENFLKSYQGVVVMISHDKMFLDEVTNRTIEISMGKIYDFDKPYSKYLTLRHDIIEKQLATQKNQLKKIEETEKLIQKFRAKASKASMAQSLIKKLDKMEVTQVDEVDQSVMNINFPMSVAPGRVVIETESLTKYYDNKLIFKDISIAIERGQKVALVGQNGQGKSTFIKAVINEIDYTGTIKLGHNVKLGYFEQNQAEYLDDNKTVLDIMIEASNDTNRTKVRDFLGAFLFSGDQVDKKVKVLSGGERNRLALCKMMLTPMNVLLLDEPTNHLDILSKQVLKQAIQKFEGALIVVSHDRDFLSGLTDLVYEFKDHKTQQYLGDINYFLESKKLNDMRAFETQKAEILSEKLKENVDHSDHKIKKTLQNKLAKTEHDIAKLESDLQKIEKKMIENPNIIHEKTNFLEEYQQKKTTLDQLMLAWEELSEQIEN